MTGENLTPTEVKPLQVAVTSTPTARNAGPKLTSVLVSPVDVSAPTPPTARIPSESSLQLQVKELCLRFVA